MKYWALYLLSPAILLAGCEAHPHRKASGQRFDVESKMRITLIRDKKTGCEFVGNWSAGLVVIPGTCYAKAVKP